VSVQPQVSASSRSDKVVEQLSSRLASIEKEIAVAKLEIENNRRNKLQWEQDVVNNTDSNNHLRVEIKKIMNVLENKQKVLEQTKRESTLLENKVKQLKDEALASRKQLEDLRRREQVLEHDRDLAVKEKNQIQYKKNSLQENIAQLQMRCDGELNVLQGELDSIIRQTEGIIDKNECLMENITKKIKQRQQYVQSVYLIKRQVRVNTESFVERVRSDLQSLKTEMNNKTVSQCTTNTVIQCKSEVNSLITRIKTIAVEMAES
ncbi:hypothetical protein K501DRAFT_146704, partial [Backusella circina FSU 941]